MNRALASATSTSSPTASIAVTAAGLPASPARKAPSERPPASKAATRGLAPQPLVPNRLDRRDRGRLARFAGGEAAQRAAPGLEDVHAAERPDKDAAVGPGRQAGRAPGRRPAPGRRAVRLADAPGTLTEHHKPGA